MSRHRLIFSGSRSQTFGAWAVLAGFWALTGIGVIWAQSPQQSAVSGAANASHGGTVPGAETILGDATTESDDTGQLRREGTRLYDKRGHFELSGSRVLFVVEHRGASYVGLENLNLQRISQIVAGDADAVEWTVSGVVTEYQGANYLLITRATKSASGSGRRRSF